MGVRVVVIPSARNLAGAPRAIFSRVKAIHSLRQPSAALHLFRIAEA